MNEERLTRRTLIGIFAVGLVVALLALAVVAVSGVLPAPAFRAQSQIALVPAKPAAPPVGSPADTTAEWEGLAGGDAGKVASEILQLPQWSDIGAKAASVTPDTISVSPLAIEGTTLINVKLDAPTAEAAETALAAILEAVKPQIKQVTGNYEIFVSQPPQGTATKSGIPVSQLLIVVFIGGMLMGSGGALIVVRARGKRAESPRPPAYDTGEHRTPVPRPPNSGEFRQQSAAPSPPRDGGPRPNAQPGSQPNGQADPRPQHRRPGADPRPFR